ncbi:MAG: radical SAM protein [Candidatus Omnitrophica bacterium]|nr:radical SAM protein [Candidatus Omnitrophota bacterium]
MTIPLQTGVMYGPLESRRFGKSLGVNLLPSDQKVCSFDCLYCQYGRTRLGKPVRFPEAAEVEEEASRFFSSAGDRREEIRWIMIAGNGEPTLHPEFPKIVRMLKSLRDRWFPQVPIGILSNSATCHWTDIHDSLSLLDGRFMKLDAGSPDVLGAVNQPLNKNIWPQMIGGLYRLRHIVLQSLFVRGDTDNTSEKIVEDWIHTVAYIRPESVQLYTIDRPPAEGSVQSVERTRLEAIAARLREKTQIPSFVF